MIAVAPEVVGQLHTDLYEARNEVVYGARRATRFIKDMVAGKEIDGKKYKFNADFILELHRRLFFQDPNAVGGLRKLDLVTVSGKDVATAVEIFSRFPLFGRWLEEQTEYLYANPEDLQGALNIAAAAHYGIVMPELHPFENGNGRTARALMNAILMSQSYELTAFGLAIPPVPILRVVGDDSYVNSLKKVDETKDLRPFMAFIAKKWIESLDERLINIDRNLNGHRTRADISLINKLESRQHKIRKFIYEGNIAHDSEVLFNHIHGKHKIDIRTFPVPDYFALRYIKP